MTYTTTHFDGLTGEQVERDMNAQELTEFEETLKEYNKDVEKRQEEQDAKDAEKVALYSKLGITEEEAKLLLS
jgi:hypothetical protein